MPSRRPGSHSASFEAKTARGSFAASRVSSKIKKSLLICAMNWRWQEDQLGSYCTGKRIDSTGSCSCLPAVKCLDIVR